MPKIPQLGEKQRVGLESPVQATGADTTEAQAMQQLGNTVFNAAQTYGQLQKERERTSSALAAADFTHRMELAAQNAKHELAVGNEVLPDGSNYTQLFQKKIAHVFDDAEKLEGNIKSSAISAANGVFLKHRAESINRELVLYNNFQFQEVEKIKEDAASLVTNDPGSFEGSLSVLNSTIDFMNISQDNKDKMKKEVEKDLQASVLAGYYEKGRTNPKVFDDAYDFVDSLNITGAEKRALQENVEENRRQALTDIWTEDSRRRTRENWQREDDAIDATIDIMDDLLAPDPAARKRGMEKARLGMRNKLFGASQISAFKKIGEDSQKDTSEVYFTYLHDRLMRGDRLKTFRDDVMAHYGNEQLVGPHARALLQKLKERRKGSNRILNDRIKAGEQMLRGAFGNPEFLENIDEETRKDRLAKLNLARVHSINLRAQGVDPIKAAFKAIETIEPSNSFLLERGFILNGKRPEELLQEINTEILKREKYLEKNMSNLTQDQLERLDKEFGVFETKKSLVKERLPHDSTYKEIMEEKKGAKGE